MSRCPNRVDVYSKRLSSDAPGHPTLRNASQSYKNTRRIPSFAQGHSVLFRSFSESFQYEMYFSHSLIFALLPFFTAAIPLARPPPTSRGVAISIGKRGGSTINNPSYYANAVQNSIA